MEEWKCFLCGHKVMWQSDYDFEDFGCDGEGIVHTFVCSHCGADYVVYDGTSEDG